MMDEEFETYRDTITFSKSCSQDYKDGCMDGAELAWYHQQSKLDEKDRDVEALKYCIIDLINRMGVEIAFADDFFVKHGLIDENGNPTKLLKPETSTTPPPQPEQKGQEQTE